jgi:hypothetical protein
MPGADPEFTSIKLGREAYTALIASHHEAGQGSYLRALAVRPRTPVGPAGLDGESRDRGAGTGAEARYSVSAATYRAITQLSLRASEPSCHRILEAAGRITWAAA